MRGFVWAPWLCVRIRREYLRHTSFEIATSVFKHQFSNSLFLNIQVFRDMTPCLLVRSPKIVDGTVEGGRKFLRNTDTHPITDSSVL